MLDVVCSFHALGGLFFENVIDGRVEQGTVAGEVNAPRIRLTIDQIQPARAIRVFADQLDLPAQRRITSSKLSIGHAVNVADRLEPFDRADDLAARDARAFRLLPLHFDNLAKHARCKFREPNPPAVALDARQPEVRRAVETVHREVRDEIGAFVEGGHGRWRANIEHPASNIQHRMVWARLGSGGKSQSVCARYSITSRQLGFSSTQSQHALSTTSPAPSRIQRQASQSVMRRA